MIPCCGHHIDHFDNSSNVHIQGCLTGINYWVLHTDKSIKLTTELKTEIIVSNKEYESEIKSFVDKVEEFYKLSKPKQMPDDNYDRIGYELMWKEWTLRRTRIDMK